MPPITDPESKRKLYTYLAEGVFAIVVLGLAAPFLYSALEGAILLAALGAVGLLTWGFAAPFGQWVANKRIAALKAVIEANPIETMETIYAQKVGELNAQSKAITEVDTQYRNVQNMVAGLKKTDPAEAVQYQDIVDKIHEGLTQMEADYDYADGQLKEYKGQIDKAERLWKVAVAINTALAVSEKARADVFRDIKQKVAFDTVTTNLNRAFAKLDTSVREHRQAAFPPSDEAKALPPASAPDSVVIDLTKAGQHQKIAG